MTILGWVLLALALGILMLLALLFVAGGGGDMDRFAVVVRQFVTASAMVGALGLASLVVGHIITRK
ncbi:hypothetical protein GCM10029976_088850 [Kribbella albertanoniae]|uniref:Uncharacterized protein n=1 Tax=Kribbella albertanoniae TaxID=1266829 RepID=A0A4R4NZB4_9ACTN|nr:hypothetical protein [Kribbella albertanoniae]TDC14494.1 hypothetical protein E1261_42735 [Kribbella albertanoniae]